MGVNHYLGTFDSEWDAAAIYAWAHLILYGEEATRQAQKEGEEAANAYEKEKQDILAGKILPPTQKPKKKKPPKKDKGEGGTQDGGEEGKGESISPDKGTETSSKKRKSTNISTGEKKAKTNTKACKLEKEAIGSTVAKGVTKVRVLSQATIVFQFTNPVHRPRFLPRETRLKICLIQNYWKWPPRALSLREKRVTEYRTAGVPSPLSTKLFALASL
jgi:hypothetical protein